MNAPPLILLVDDDPDFLAINGQVLEAAGYRVVEAGSPQQAFEKIAAEPPALIISDLMMVSIDAGFAFARRVREDERLRNVPIILATAVTGQLGYDFRPRTPEELKAMQVDAYFDKPIPPKKLLAKVAELLKKSEQ